MEARIYEIVKKELATLGTDAPFVVEWPADMSHGDFAVNAALAASKALGKPPREIAELLLPGIKKGLGEDAQTVDIAGPGFINITLSPDAVDHILREAVSANDSWGKNNDRAGMSVMIEYGNPNPFKEMHIGHLVGTVIGESLARLTEANGARVLRDTFGGDVGPQVAKALWVFLKNDETDIASSEEIGKAYTRGATAYEESETAKREIDALNVRLYDVVEKQSATETLSEEDRALLYLWQKGREVSMQEFARLFALLDTHHDYTFFDSDTTKPGLDAVNDALEKGILERSEGAIIYPGNDAGRHTLVFVTSRGTPTYETKDIGLAFIKEMQAPTDEVTILTAIEQQGHFNVVLAALSEIAPSLSQKTKHLAHGLLTLTTGKMSSRKGNVITARELLQEVVEKASERNDDPVVAEQVGVAALKYMILRSAPGGSIVFDPEKSLALDGDSGPYLQYALVRAKSILAKASGTNEKASTTKKSSYTLSRLITRFPAVVKKAQEHNGPHILTQYITQLAGEWNSFYANERIIGEPDEAEKISIAQAFVQTMENGLALLGIPAPEKM